MIDEEQKVQLIKVAEEITQSKLNEQQQHKLIETYDNSAGTTHNKIKKSIENVSEIRIPEYEKRDYSLDAISSSLAKIRIAAAKLDNSKENKK